MSKKLTADMTADEYRNHMAQKSLKKKSKFNAVWVEYQGLKFPSAGERDRWITLNALQDAGFISDLKRQQEYDLNPGGAFTYKARWDFTYNENGKFVVEDFKGFETDEFKKKKKLMFKIYGITIKVVKK